jgi:hypothetical protein
VLAALERDTLYWRIKHTCPACTYVLEGEPELTFKMLTTMDGNDSQKRMATCEAPQCPEDDDLTEGAMPRLGESHELRDLRKVTGDYYLKREQVEVWAKEFLVDIPRVEGESDPEESPCADRWHNMINDVVSKMWGIFDETGIFLSLCHHGFVLVVADMVHSGELTKYGLAVTEVLLKALGDKLGNGYDVGCKFGITVDHSDLGPLARELHYRSLVGSFHGHAHNRLCQLNYLTTYIKGLGLEDLEGCERFFCKSNALATSLRYASIFHRQQKIVEFMMHMDAFETYQNLSLFLVNNYHQALDILKGEPVLKKTMADQGIPDAAVFDKWLTEEREYLCGLSKEPMQETIEMEYYQRLVNLKLSK